MTQTQTTLSLSYWSRSRHQLVFGYRFDDLSFSSAFWYEGADLYLLEERYGEEFMRRVYFHIAAFDINKIASLRPDKLDWGPLAEFATPEFAVLWETIFRNVWAQWRYENEDPQYFGPEFETAETPPGAPAETGKGEADILAFCGGGKDSLVAMKLLERSGARFDSLTYASSIYGNQKAQCELLDGLLDQGSPGERRRLWMFDDFMDSPVLKLGGQGGVSKTLTAAETPSSIFTAIPFALQHGYRSFSLGHERSADTGQVFWEETGEDVNHQWGKSLEAEELLNGYVQKHLVADLTYFSILKPIYDVMIFNLLRRDENAVPFTHSCNEEKPWCKRCPKCAYVWLGYMAWLPTDLVDGCFGGTNLFDLEENQETFMQLVGAADQLPFECIGQANESRLAFEMCRSKGLGGKAMDRYLELGLDADRDKILGHYLDVGEPSPHFPGHVWEPMKALLEETAETAKQYVAGVSASGTPV